MAMKKTAVPSGYEGVIPYLLVRGASRAIAFYRSALGAKLLEQRKGPGGRTVHAEMQLGGRVFMLSDESASARSRAGQTRVRLLVYVKDVDAAFRKALKVGASAELRPADMFWGDRYARIVDPFGHRWDLATRREEVSTVEIARRQTVYSKPKRSR